MRKLKCLYEFVDTLRREWSGKGEGPLPCPWSLLPDPVRPFRCPTRACPRERNIDGSWAGGAARDATLRWSGYVLASDWFTRGLNRQGSIIAEHRTSTRDEAAAEYPSLVCRRPAEQAAIETFRRWKGACWRA